MDDALLVRRGQTVRELDRVIDHSANRQCTCTQPLTQRFPFEQLRYDVGRAAIRPMSNTDRMLG